MAVSRLPILAYARFVAVFCASFFPVYVVGLIHGARSQSVWRIYAEWERHIPLVEWMIIPYLSLFPAYLMPLFTLDASGLSRLTKQSVVTILSAGLCFLIVPTTPGFAPEQPGGPFASLFELVRLVDRPHNLLPSLHVAGAALVLLAGAQASAQPAATLFRAWLLVMMVSTVLVHQHHLADVAAGLLLAVVVRCLIPLRPDPAAP